MPLIWQVRCYVSPDGVDRIREAYEASSRKIQGQFLSRLRTLAQLPIQQWQLPLYRVLHRECSGVGEMRFKGDNVQQRPLGFHGPGNIFTLTFWATEKSNHFIPRNACEIALGRKQEILADRNRSNACWLKLE